MSKVVLYMSMSVDGFSTGPDDNGEQGLGVGRGRLHAWLADGGVDPASYRACDHHRGVPILVLTHTAHGEPAPGSARYGTDGIASCIAQAKAAAGVRHLRYRVRKEG
jgi:hypothetical protein